MFIFLESHHGLISYLNLISRRKEVRDSHTHQQLKKDLIEHIWDKFGHLQNNNM